MAMLEKTITPAYSRVSDDESSQSATESDGFIYGGYQAKKTSRRKKILIALVGFSVFVAYSALLTTATTMWWKKERLHGANVVDSKFYIKVHSCPISTADSLFSSYKTVHKSE